MSSRVSLGLRPFVAAICGRLRLIISAITVLVATATGFSQTLNFTSVPDGYTAGSIDLPRPFAGALAADPTDPNVIYAAVGFYLDMAVARVNLTDGSATLIAHGPFASIGGIAVLSPTRIVVTDNGAVAGGPPDETILLLKDYNPRNGEFDDSGEVVELIHPILTSGGNFSGSQARIAPRRNFSKIPGGAVVVQTADGDGNAELLVVQQPLRRPSFRPSGGAFFGGFDYNGGFDFDSFGRIFMGTVEGTYFTGQVIALVNTNGDGVIGPGESHTVVSWENGMSDLIIDGSDNVFFTGYDPYFTAAVRTFPVPVNPLTDTASPENFALTDAGYLSALILNSKALPFDPNSGPGATMALSGYTGFFEQATNLLTLTPYQ